MTANSRPPMTPERWRRVESLVDAALDLPTAERDDWLREACAGDDGLRREVARLLAAADEPNAALDAGVRSFAGLVAEVERRAVGTPAPAPDRVGPWRVIAPAGEGGMGTVYVVERDDGEYRMRAALKVVRHGLHLDDAFLRRFREERQILARLDHPNIARLLDGGVTDDGRPYYVMEFVDGAPIDRWCDQRALGIDGRLALFAKVCDAVAAAHQRDIVHRDLKPSNVLVSEQGQPKLLDFGIAKTLATARHATEWGVNEAESTRAVRSTLTRTGERLLTPEYAAPEQIRGEAVTAATDVYALGVLLYELLTGQRPYHGRNRSRHEIERAILEDTPTRPSAAAARPLAGLGPAEIRRRLRGDLDTIILAALRKEPERRYASAVELGDDVRRHMEGRAVRARGDSAAYRVHVWVGRHRRTVVAAVAGTLVGAAALAVALARGTEPRPPDWAGTAGLREEVSTRSPLARRYFADGLRAHARGNWGEATRHFHSALREDSTFAIAAAYGWDAALRDEDYQAAGSMRDLAVRHAERASPRERFVVLANYAWRMRSPLLAAYADSLTRQATGASEAALWRGRAAAQQGDWAAAAAEFRRAVSLDSAALAHDSVPCHSCAARFEIVIAHLWADSLATAEREARDLAAAHPAAAVAWQMLATVQMMRGRPHDTAFRRRVELDPGDVDFAVEMIADPQLRAAEFHAADELLRGRLATAPPGREERSLGWLVTSMRMQERWEEALVLARRARALVSDVREGAVHPAAIAEAQVLLESGRPREAAALFDSISRWPSGVATGNRAWHLAHMAGALAAAGDTAALPALIDTVRVAAAPSGYVRDARLHHHIEGLLLAARGRDQEAVDAFRRAIFSWNMGYTRTNLELARALLRLDRPAEAVAALQPALRGSLEVNNTYVTHTELHRVLARAWRAAGNADSAEAHERWVRAATRR